MDALTTGGRAALELQLQDTQRDLLALIREKNGYLAQADVFSALACEPGRRTVSSNAVAANLRLKAFTLGGDIATLRLKVRNIESQLKGSTAQGAPVVLSIEAGRDMEDTINFQGVPA